MRARLAAGELGLDIYEHARSAGSEGTHLPGREGLIHCSPAFPCTLMRGGTSKGLYFHAADLPPDRELRDRVLLAAMGSPDTAPDRRPGRRPSADQQGRADVAFHACSGATSTIYSCRSWSTSAEVSDSQNCGNLLAGVGPWAIENGLVPVAGASTPVRIHMVNTGSLAVAHVRTPQGAVEYEGDARIDGVPGTAAPIALEFLDVAGSSCGALLPTGAVSERFEGIELTCIDNGMPVIIVRATDLGVTRRGKAGAARSQCGAGGEGRSASGWRWARA